MYIPVPGEVTPEWLTAVLHQADVVETGEVTAVKIQNNLSACHCTLLCGKYDEQSGIVKICSECRITGY